MGKNGVKIRWFGQKKSKCPKHYGLKKRVIKLYWFFLFLQNLLLLTIRCNVIDSEVGRKSKKREKACFFVGSKKFTRGRCWEGVRVRGRGVRL